MISNKLRENGQVLVVIALASIVLFGFVALAIDGSAKFSDRRRSQNAADTAALAAALAKVNALSDPANYSNTPVECPPISGSPSDVCAALLLDGLERAISNGYGDDITKNTVEIYSPPISGYYSTVSNKAEYVQVIITSHVKTYFARVFGINQTNNIVQAVALAKPGKNLAQGAMVISYDPNPNCSVGGTGGSSVKVSGAATINLYGGGILLNSNASCGFTIPNCADLHITGGAGVNTAGSNNINTTGCTFTPPLTKKYNQDPIAVPDDVYFPNEPPECKMSGSPTPYKFPTQIMGTDSKLHDQWLIYPGFYTDFPQAALVSNKSYIYMASGVYCIDPPMSQDLSWSPVSAAFLNGSTDPALNQYATAYNPYGVTLYIKKGGGFTINASSPTYLDATTKAPNGSASDYQGYLIILEGDQTTHPSCTINGGADIKMNGLIDAPYCNFTINGQAGETAPFNAQLLGWDITINGQNAINFNYDPSNQVHIKRRVGLMK